MKTFYENHASLWLVFPMIWQRQVTTAAESPCSGFGAFGRAESLQIPVQSVPDRGFGFICCHSKYFSFHTPWPLSRSLLSPSAVAGFPSSLFRIISVTLPKNSGVLLLLHPGSPPFYVLPLRGRSITAMCVSVLWCQQVGLKRGV